jgi:hypothetical protein
MERALALAEARTGDDEAIQDLLSCCGGKRVSVVLARRHLVDEPEGHEEGADRAVHLLDELLRRLPEE